MKNNIRLRSSSGSMLALIAAITVGIVIALIFFFMNFGRILGGFNQQKTAIEAAALAAATDLTNIVVPTNTCGYVSLSDAAPVGLNTAANDNYYLPVHSINTLIGTARLDMIIADQIGDGTMLDLAYEDTLNICNDALPLLQINLQDALQQSPAKGPYYDIAGNVVQPYQDALNAYQNNRINMTESSQMSGGSFKLELGYLNKPTPTNIPIPQPTALAGLAASQYTTGSVNMYSNIPVYLSYTPVQYAGKNVTCQFMFAGIGNSVTLADTRNFQPVPRITKVPAAVSQPNFTLQSVAFTISAQADQVYINSQDKNQTPIHEIACAQPGNSIDPRPAPGMLEISFPDGGVPEIQTMNDLMTYKQLELSAGGVDTADVLAAANGDYPGPNGGTTSTSSLQNTLNNGNNAWPIDNTSKPVAGNFPPYIGQVVNMGIYDWIRSAGCAANVSSAVSIVGAGSQLYYNIGTKPWVAIPPPPGAPMNITQTAQSSSPAKAQIPVGYVCLFRWANATGSPYTVAQTKPPVSPIKPMPYEVVSNNEVFGEQISAITKSSVGIITWTNVPGIQVNGVLGNFGNFVKATDSWDVSVRSQVRYPGPNDAAPVPPTVFDHAGQPLPVNLPGFLTRLPISDKQMKRLIAAGLPNAPIEHGTVKGLVEETAGAGAWHHNGNGNGNGGGQQGGQSGGSHGNGGPGGGPPGNGGAHPVLGAENDFDIGTKIIPPYAIKSPYYVTYAEPYGSPYPSGPQRPVYTVNGSAVQIRFRRQAYAIVTSATVTGSSTYTYTDTSQTSGVGVATTYYTGAGQSADNTGYFADEL